MKSPFEIRYDLIALAHDHLEKEFIANSKFAEAMLKEAVNMGQLYTDAITKYMPKYPSFEEVIELARKWGTFVDGKPSK
jgi:hypothetical protein